MGNGVDVPVSWSLGACACPARMFAITVANPAFAGGGGVRGQTRGRMNTRVNIIVTNWRPQVLTRSRTLTSSSEFLLSHTRVFCCLFFVPPHSSR